MTEPPATRITFTKTDIPDMGPIEREFAAIRPYGGASLIMADPPWHHEDWSQSGNKKKTASHHYQTLPLSWIKALPVHVLAGHDCVLWLWTTSPLLPVAIDVMAAWGFRWSTSGAWIKRTVTGKLAFGGGRRLRSCHEPYIIATKGRPPVAEAIRSAIEAHVDTEDPLTETGWTVEAVRREHSRKPDEAFEAARRMVDGPAVELFSRERRNGWTVWGNEVGKFAEAAE